MAVTTGYVQRLSILNSGLACAFVGPAPTNTAALIVQSAATDSPGDIAWKSSIVDGLTTAMTARQQVQVTHGDTDAQISALTLGPG